MKEYVKPVVLANEEMTEDVYAASGGGGDTGGETGSGVVCGSKYMNGQFVPTVGGNFTPGATNKQARGCEGCFAAWGDRCAISDPYFNPNQNPLMPDWEKKGEGPDDSAQPGDYS